MLSEKHRRGAAARFVRAMKQKKKSCYANGSKGSFGGWVFRALSSIFPHYWLTNDTLIIIRFKAEA